MGGPGLGCGFWVLRGAEAALSKSRSRTGPEQPSGKMPRLQVKERFPLANPETHSLDGNVGDELSQWN